jgi:hypothetical protein
VHPTITGRIGGDERFELGEDGLGAES